MLSKVEATELTESASNETLVTFHRELSINIVESFQRDNVVDDRERHKRVGRIG